MVYEKERLKAVRYTNVKDMRQLKVLSLKLLEAKG